MKIGKYQFESKTQAQAKIGSLGTAIDQNGNESPTHNHTIVSLGYIVLKQAVIDEEGEVVTEAVLSEGWHVDVMWIGLEDHPYGWKSYSVDLASEGSHGFAGMPYLSHEFL